MKKILLLGILLTLLPFIQGCMTATYGKSFEQAQAQDQYTLTIYTSAFTSQKEATERVNEESKKFMTKKLLLLALLNSFAMFSQIIFNDDFSSYSSGQPLSGQGSWTNNSSLNGSMGVWLLA